MRRLSAAHLIVVSATQFSLSRD